MHNLKMRLANATGSSNVKIRMQAGCTGSFEYLCKPTAAFLSLEGLLQESPPPLSSHSWQDVPRMLLFIILLLPFEQSCMSSFAGAVGFLPQVGSIEGGAKCDAFSKAELLDHVMLHSGCCCGR